MKRPSTSINSVRIQNYKNITDTGKVELTDIVVLLGKNEAGKSSILEAIEYLGNEEPIPSAALPHDKQLQTSDDEIEIASAEVQLTRNVVQEAYAPLESDLENTSFPVKFEITKFADGSRRFSSELIDEEKVKRINEMVAEVAKTRGRFEDIFDASKSGVDDPIDEIIDELVGICDRNYDINESSHASEIINRSERIVELSARTDMEKGSRKDVLEGLADHLEQAKTEVEPPDPNILYYQSQFSISDSYDLKSDNEKATFKNMLDIGGFSSEDYKEVSDKNRYLDEVSQQISERINRAWSQKEFDISIRTGGDGNLSLYIRDMTASDQQDVSRSLTKISERSDGFRWFFSFFIEIISQSDEGAIEEKILLFDDPAIQLHPEGKRDWLRTVVNEVGHSDQVIYTAHSPYLIDKDRPTRIRIVEDTNEHNTIIRSDVLNPEADPDSLEPLRNALGINLGDSPFLSKKTLLVEGTSDYYIITGALNYFQDYMGRYHFESNKVTVNPSNGADQMPTLASWLSAQEIDFAMLLDSDEGGQNVYEKIKNDKYIGVGAEDTTLLSKSKIDEGLVIEDMFTPRFYIQSFNAVMNDIADDVGVNYREVVVSRDDSDYIVGVADPGTDEWRIGPVTYDGTRLDTILKEIISSQSIANEIKDSSGEVRIFKRQVAEHIHLRLANGDSPADELEHFNHLFGKIGTILDL